MENSKSASFSLLRSLAIVGNIVFVLWILINGINEGFKGTNVEKFSYITLMGLLTVNAFLLIRRKEG